MREKPVEQEKTNATATTEQIFRMVSLLERGAPSDNFLMRLVCVNFFVLFCRPQDWPGLSIFGTIRMPMIISIIVLLVWLPSFNKSFHTISKYLMFFLVFELLRFFVGYVLDPNNTIVRNDYYQFHTWKDLFLQFTALAFPIVVTMRSERAFKALASTLALCGVLLGLYAATHSGVGPGGFLGDENDACLAMVMLLPFSVMLFGMFRGGFLKVLMVLSALLLCLGIVSTNSRGGFLGFAAVLGLFFLRSDRKLLTLAGGVLALLISLPLIPQEYIDEIVSIKTEAGADTGTMRERLDTWEVAFRVFRDPRHILFGVGLNNVPYWFNEYEDADRGRFTKSLSGRAMHSVYFQILPDLGLYGVIVIGGIFWFSIRGNSRLTKRYEHYGQRLSRALVSSSAAGKPIAVDADYERQMLTQRLLRQVRVGREIAKTLNVSWAGTLAAGIGVSALYYPPIWFLAACSAGIQLHGQLLTRAAESLFASIDEESLKPNSN